MTVQQAYLDLLSLVGVDNPAFAGDALAARVLSDINASLQKLWLMMAPWWSTETRGVVLKDPLSTVVGVQTGSREAAVSGWSAAAMSELLELTIRIEGDVKDNKVVSYDGGPSNWTLLLALPYGGDTGTVGAKIFYDAHRLGDDVLGVQAPVVIAGEHELVGLRSPRDVLAFAESGGHGRGHYDGQMASASRVAELKDVDVPIGYYVEARTSGAETELVLRFSPMPDRRYSVRYDVRRRPPVVASLTPGTAELPVPTGFAESVFLPLLRYQFTTHKYFDSGQLRGIMKQQYEDAFQLLARIKPQVAKVGRVRVVE